MIQRLDPTHARKVWQDKGHGMWSASVVVGKFAFSYSTVSADSGTAPVNAERYEPKAVA